MQQVINVALLAVITLQNTLFSMQVCRDKQSYFAGEKRLIVICEKWKAEIIWLCLTSGYNGGEGLFILPIVQTT